MTQQATNQYPAPHEDLQAPLGGMLREYPDYPGGYVEEIVKEPGRTLNMGFLADRSLADPTAMAWLITKLAAESLWTVHQTLEIRSTI